MDFFILGELLWMLTSPEGWLLLGLALGIVALWTAHLRAARFLLTAVGLAVAVLTFFPVANPLLRPLETAFPVPDVRNVGAIVILGGGEDPHNAAAWQQPALERSGDRIFAGLTLAALHPNAQVIYTGRNERLLNLGLTGPLDPAIEAMGKLSPSRFIREDKSRSTFENAIFTKPLLSPTDGGAVLLVTSAWHMPRSVAAFCAAGIPTVPFPVDFRSKRRAGLQGEFSKHLADLRTAVHEYIGLVAYRATGRTDTLFPKGC